MPTLPQAFGPPSETEFILPSGRSITLARVRPVFHQWRGTPMGGATVASDLVDCEGHPAPAELATLWALRSAGWEGVWVDRTDGLHRTGPRDTPPVPSLPPLAAQTLARINAAAGVRHSRKGAWSVVCWRSEEVLFANVLRLGREQFRSSQLSWLEAGLLSGYLPDAFLLVEWSLDANGLSHHADAR